MKRLFWSARRWWNKRFSTTVEPGRYNAYAGRKLTVDDWDRIGAWEGALVWGWKVERPDWWDMGAYSAITDATVERARARLDEWQDEAYARHLQEHR